MTFAKSGKTKKVSKGIYAHSIATIAGLGKED
jgi:hypothetical protein